jgi:hypothetical protein
MSSGTCTCKIKCEPAEFGDEAKDTLNFMPSILALVVPIVPGVETSPTTFAVRQLWPLLQVALICNVATLAGQLVGPQINRSLPFVDSACSGREILVRTPFWKFELV